jgi:microcystin-dependent protein
MAYNGAGSFSRLFNFVQDKANGIFIDSTRMDSEMNGIATGLSSVICKDGQTTLTGDIPWNGKKITGYGTANTPNSRSDVPQLGQVQDATVNWVAAGGTADAITATYAPVITALVDGQECRFRASAANATTTPTFSPNALTAHTITKQGGAALVAGDIPGNLAEIVLRYNLANTRWELLNPANLLQSPWSTGDVKPTLKTVADTTWVMMNDGTIGDASSGGTTRANADTSALFTLLWNNTADADCAVSGGRGANAAADFAAHKTIALPKSLGRALAFAGAGSGLTSRALAHVIGEETHLLSAAEVPSHTHSVPAESVSGSASGSVSGVVVSGSTTTGYSVAGGSPLPDPITSLNTGSAGLSGGTITGTTTGTTTGSAGSGGAHNNMQPTTFLNFMIKL